MKRTLAKATLGVFALSVTAQAETVQFTAQLASDIAVSAKPATATGPAKGSATLSLDTATRTVHWTIEYSGLSGALQGVSCGALATPGGPAIALTGNLASPIEGTKALTEPEIATLAAGDWLCVIAGGDDEAEIGGVLQQAR